MTKIVDTTEVRRWFEQGLTYREMTEIYRQKYNIETTPSMWGNFRRRWGLARRINRDDVLIPWMVSEEHRYHYAITMLRIEARLRAGLSVPERRLRNLETWKDGLRDSGAVVHYDPDTEEGFFYVPRQAGDGDLIHEPDQRTGKPRLD